MSVEAPEKVYTSVNLIVGPVSSGKTRKLCEIINDSLDSGKRVLACYVHDLNGYGGEDDNKILVKESDNLHHIQLIHPSKFTNDKINEIYQNIPDGTDVVVLDDCMSFENDYESKKNKLDLIEKLSRQFNIETYVTQRIGGLYTYKDSSNFKFNKELDMLEGYDLLQAK